ncbi:MAG TPA: ribonuclease H-like domain-containing protein [Clostridiaceae bacterium]|nr:ribonuclease H-like domain-containing protein [Clostridiaceae bacterium]
MLRKEQIIPMDKCMDNVLLKIGDEDIIDRSIFFDLEHYLYKKPICIGVFGAAVYDPESQALVSTQYMIENKKDAEEILYLAEDYFLRMKKEGKDNIVTFSGNNDFTVINHLFNKHEIDMTFDDLFRKVDLQKEYEKKFKKNIGLKNLERLFSIKREGEVISGATLAKTFSRIMKDRDYIHRMPAEKVHKILVYNEQDVVNLARIMNHWEAVDITDVLTLEGIILEEKMRRLEALQREEELRQRLLENEEELLKDMDTFDDMTDMHGKLNIDPLGQ